MNGCLSIFRGQQVEAECQIVAELLQSLYFGMEMGICDYEFRCRATLSTQGISPIWAIVSKIIEVAHFSL